MDIILWVIGIGFALYAIGYFIYYAVFTLSMAMYIADSSGIFIIGLLFAILSVVTNSVSRTNGNILFILGVAGQYLWFRYRESVRQKDYIHDDPFSWKDKLLLILIISAFTYFGITVNLEKVLWN